MSHYLLTLGSKAPSISYRYSNQQRLLTTLSPPGDIDFEFKINDTLKEFAFDLFKQAVKDELLEKLRSLLEYLF